MQISLNETIVFLSQLIILSYLYNLFSRWSKIPSVVLLMATGVALKYTSLHFGLDYSSLTRLVPLLGTVGLIMIVLESTLDLHIERNKLGLVGKSALTALAILILSIIPVSAIIYYFVHESWREALIYATAFSVISSSVVLPSVQHLSRDKRDFIIYEATFSDIIGIVLFNFITFNGVITSGTALLFSGQFLLTVCISIAAAMLLIYFMTSIRSSVKIFLIFSILTLLYSYGKMFHLPSLLLIFSFGLFLRNIKMVPGLKVDKFVNEQKLAPTFQQLHFITAETAFLIRTFFFVLFGYSMDLTLMLNWEVTMYGSLIVLALLFVRFLYLRFILHSDLFPELFIMPRGLITILLFYSIPAQFQISHFNEGILFFVIVATSILMMIGLLFNKDKELETKEEPVNLI
jgi:Kef-type K+ transport system membrane component KefB